MVNFLFRCAWWSADCAFLGARPVWSRPRECIRSVSKFVAASSVTQAGNQRRDRGQPQGDRYGVGVKGSMRAFSSLSLLDFIYTGFRAACL
jgi:hypothetical protein